MKKKNSKNMKIKMDDSHILCADGFCYWINNITPKGQIRRASGYYPNLQTLISGYIEKTICSSEAETLKDLSAQIETLKTQTEAWAKGLNDALNEKRKKHGR